MFCLFCKLPYRIQLYFRRLNDSFFFESPLIIFKRIILKVSDVQLIDNLFLYFLIVAGVILALVIFFVFYFLIKYQSKSDFDLPSQKERGERMEWILGSIATITVGVFAYLSFVTMDEIQTIPEGSTPFIEITGHQWWWEAKYPESGVVTANQIHIPVGKRILLKLNSADVIHSWWVPELGRKMDMIPGIDNYIWFYAGEAGEFEGPCSEFCGTQHARMRIRVIAQSQEDFNDWVDRQLKPIVSTGGPLFMEGKQLFEVKTCTHCHTVGSENNSESIGPDLTHFASRKWFLANWKENNSRNLRAWLTNPQKVKSGARMPNFIFTENELNALVAYVHGLR